ncbi:MAG: hypothetical protein WCJ47_08290 [Methanomicrobiales archaeon]
MVCVKSAKDIMHLICQFENPEARKCCDGVTGEKDLRQRPYNRSQSGNPVAQKKRDEKQGNYAKI